MNQSFYSCWFKDRIFKFSKWSFYFKHFIYLFEKESELEWIWAGGAEGEEQADLPAQPCWAGSPMMQVSIPGPQDHDLSPRQTLNQLSHPSALNGHFMTFRQMFKYHLHMNIIKVRMDTWHWKGKDQSKGKGKWVIENTFIEQYMILIVIER